MPCCGATYVKTAFVLGVVMASLNLLVCLGGLMFGELSFIMTGIVGALICGILIYGAHARKGQVILVFMIITAVEFIVFTIMDAFDIDARIKEARATKKTNEVSIIIGSYVFGYLVTTAFYGFTLIVARNARKEVDVTDGRGYVLS